MVEYLGQSYSTEMWEYDNSTVIGYAGEKVEMDLLEKTISTIAFNSGTGKYLVLDLTKKFGNDKTKDSNRKIVSYP